MPEFETLMPVCDCTLSGCLSTSGNSEQVGTYLPSVGVLSQGGAAGRVNTFRTHDQTPPTAQSR
jgi:hypothetical protein